MFALGREVTKVIDGRSYTFARLERRIVEEFRDWIAEREGDPFADVKQFLPSLDPATAKAMIDEAKSVKAQLQAFSLGCPLAKKYLNTELGQAQLFYFLLRRNHPDITPEKAFDVWASMAGSGEVKKLLEQTQGKPPAEKNALAPAA